MRIIGQILCDKETRTPLMTPIVNAEGQVTMTRMTVYHGMQQQLPATMNAFPVAVLVEQAMPMRDVQINGTTSFLRFTTPGIVQMDPEAFEQLIQECGVQKTLRSLIDAVEESMAAISKATDTDSQGDGSNTIPGSPSFPIEPSNDGPISSNSLDPTTSPAD